MLREEATNTIFIVFGSTWLDLEPNLPHNNIYTADVVDNLQLKPYKLQILDLLRQGEKKVEPHLHKKVGPSWPWSYGSWIYNYLCNQCLSPLMLWGRISMRARCTTLCDKVSQSLATGRWFSPGPPVSSTNKTDHHDITEILLKVVLNTIKQTNKQKHKKVGIIKNGGWRMVDVKFWQSNKIANVLEIED